VLCYTAVGPSVCPPSINHCIATILTNSYKISLRNINTNLTHRIFTYRFNIVFTSLDIDQHIYNPLFVPSFFHFTCKLLHACIRVVLMQGSLLVAAAWLPCCLFFICMHVHLEPTSLLAAEVYFGSALPKLWTLNPLFMRTLLLLLLLLLSYQSAALGCLTSLPFISGGYLASAPSFCTSGLYLQLRAAACHINEWSFVYSVRYVYILSTFCALPLLAYASVRLHFTHASYYQALLPL